MSLPGIPGLLDSRQGLNCALAYHDEKGVTQSYAVRADLYNYDFQLIADEEYGRINHSFYPHRVTPTNFTVQVLLKGTYEYRHFMDWLSKYVWTALSANDSTGFSRAMFVSLAGRDFYRLGIPVAGYHWGDIVGATLWKVPITFISAEDALAPTDVQLTNKIQLSSFDDAAAAVSNRDIQYFYPLSAYANGTSDSAYYDNVNFIAAQLPALENANLALAEAEAHQAAAALANFGSPSTSNTPSSSVSTWGH